MEDMVKRLFSECELPDDARAEIERWLIESEDDADTDILLRREYNKLLGREYDPALAEDMLERVRVRINDNGAPLPGSVRIPLRRRKMLRIAAVLIPVLLLAGVSVLRYGSVNNGRNGENNEIALAIAGADTVDFSPEVASLPAEEEKGPDPNTGTVLPPAAEGYNAISGYQVPEDFGHALSSIDLIPVVQIKAGNESRQVALPDGSMIRLEKNAMLEYKMDFLRNRALTLKGDAFVSVAKYEGKTFEVQFNDMTIKVLGTEFYLSDSGIKNSVTLSRGSVEILTAGRNIRLEPNQQFILDVSMSDFTVFDLTEIQMSRILRGRVEFKEIPLNRVLASVGEFFDMNIEISGERDYRMPVRIVLEVHDKLDDVLFALREISGNGFEYQIAGSTVVVK